MGVWTDKAETEAESPIHDVRWAENRVLKLSGEFPGGGSRELPARTENIQRPP